MTIYRVQGPEGKILRVEGPEGASEQEVVRFAEQQYYANLPPDYTFGEIASKSFDRGLERFKSTYGDVLPAMVASSLGFDEYAKRQMEEAAQSEEYIQRTMRPQFPSFKDVNWANPIDISKFIIETAGEQAVNLAGVLVPGGIGTKVGEKLATREAVKRLLPKTVTGKAERKIIKGLIKASPEAIKGRAIGQVSGIFMGSYGLNAPEVFQNIYEQTGSFEPGAAALAGVVNAALDSILPATLLNQFSRPGRATIISKILERSGMNPNLARKAVVQIAGSGVLEGLTEATQEAVSITAENFVQDHSYLFDSDDFDRVLEGGVRGTVAGGTFRGVGVAASRLKDKYNKWQEKKDEGEAGDTGDTGDKTPPTGTTPTGRSLGEQLELDLQGGMAQPELDLQPAPTVPEQLELEGLGPKPTVDPLIPPVDPRQTELDFEGPTTPQADPGFVGPPTQQGDLFTPTTPTAPTETTQPGLDLEGGVAQPELTGLETMPFTRKELAPTEPKMTKEEVIMKANGLEYSIANSFQPNPPNLIAELQELRDTYPEVFVERDFARSHSQLGIERFEIPYEGGFKNVTKLSDTLLTKLPSPETERQKYGGSRQTGPALYNTLIENYRGKISDEKLLAVYEFMLPVVRDALSIDGIINQGDILIEDANDIPVASVQGSIRKALPEEIEKLAAQKDELLRTKTIGKELYNDLEFRFAPLTPDRLAGARISKPKTPLVYFPAAYYMEQIASVDKKGADALIEAAISKAKNAGVRYLVAEDFTSIPALNAFRNRGFKDATKYLFKGEALDTPADYGGDIKRKRGVIRKNLYLDIEADVKPKKPILPLKPVKRLDDIAEPKGNDTKVIPAGTPLYHGTRSEIDGIMSSGKLLARYEGLGQRNEGGVVTEGGLVWFIESKDSAISFGGGERKATVFSYTPKQDLNLLNRHAYISKKQADILNEIIMPRFGFSQAEINAVKKGGQHVRQHYPNNPFGAGPDVIAGEGRSFRNYVSEIYASDYYRGRVTNPYETGAPYEMREAPDKSGVIPESEMIRTKYYDVWPLVLTPLGYDGFYYAETQLALVGDQRIEFVQAPKVAPKTVAPTEGEFRSVTQMSDKSQDAINITPEELKQKGKSNQVPMGIDNLLRSEGKFIKAGAALGMDEAVANAYKNNGKVDPANIIIEDSSGTPIAAARTELYKMKMKSGKVQGKTVNFPRRKQPWVTYPTALHIPIVGSNNPQAMDVLMEEAKVRARKAGVRYLVLDDVTSEGAIKAFKKRGFKDAKKGLFEGAPLYNALQGMRDKDFKKGAYRKNLYLDLEAEVKAEVAPKTAAPTTTTTVEEKVAKKVARNKVELEMKEKAFDYDTALAQIDPTLLGKEVEATIDGVELRGTYVEFQGSPFIRYPFQGGYRQTPILVNVTVKVVKPKPAGDSDKLKSIRKGKASDKPIIDKLKTKKTLGQVLSVLKKSKINAAQKALVTILLTIPNIGKTKFKVIDNLEFSTEPRAEARKAEAIESATSQLPFPSTVMEARAKAGVLFASASQQLYDFLDANTPLSPNMIIDIIRDLENQGGEQAIIQELRKLGVKPTVSEVPGAYGLYNRQQDSIQISNNADVETVLHEAVHAATANLLNKHIRDGVGVTPLGKRIIRLYEDAIAADTEGRFTTALSKVEEFIAEAFTNPEFQKFLANNDSTEGGGFRGEDAAYEQSLVTQGVRPNVRNRIMGGRRRARNLISTLWGKFVEAIKNILGIEDTNFSYSILNDVIALAPELFVGPNATEQARATQEILLRKTDVINEVIHSGSAVPKWTKDAIIPKAIEKVTEVISRQPIANNRAGRALVSKISNVPQSLLNLYVQILSIPQQIEMFGEYLPSLNDVRTFLQSKAFEIKQGREEIERLVAYGESLKKKYSATPQSRKIFKRWNKVLLGLSGLDTNPETVLADPNGLANLTKQNPKAAALVREYQKLPTDLKDLSKQIVADLEKKYTTLLDTVLANIERNEDGTITDFEKSIREQYKNRPFYLPFVRKGDFWFEYQTRDGEYGQASADSAASRILTIKKMKAEEGITDVKFITRDKVKGAAGGTPKIFVSALKATLENNTELTENQRTGINKVIDETYLLMFPDASLKHHLQPRQGIPGYVEDIIFAYADIAPKIVSSTANQKYNNQLIIAVNNVAKEANKPGAVQSNLIRAVAKDVVNRSDFMLNPIAGPWSRGAAYGSYFWFLGFNISSAIVNITQIPLVVLPYLAGEYGGPKFGQPKAWAEIQNAIKLYAQGGFEQTERFAPDRTAAQVKINLETGEKTYIGKNAHLFKPGGKYHNLFNKAEEAAALRRGVGYEITELSRDFGAEVESGNRLLAKTEKLVGYLFQNSERLNREVTLIAAFEMEMKYGSGNKDVAIQKAIEFTSKVHSHALPEIGPSMFQDGLGKIAFVFKRFAQAQAYLVTKLFYDGPIGFSRNIKNDPNLTEQEKEQLLAEKQMAKRQLAGIYGYSFLMAGAAGVPAYGLASLIMEALFDDDDDPFDFDVFINQAVGDMMYRGPLSYTIGADISRRTGFSNLFFVEDSQRLNEIGLPTYALEMLGGPAFSALKRMSEAPEFLERGQEMRAMERIMPTAIGNAIKAWRQSMEGVRNKNGAKIIEDDPSIYETFMQVVGFTNPEVSEAYARAQALKGPEKKLSLRRQNLLTRYWLAKQVDDIEGMKDINEEIKEFNKKAPRGMRIKASTKARSMKAREKAVDDSVFGINLPKTYKKEMEDIYDIDTGNILDLDIFD